MQVYEGLMDLSRRNIWYQANYGNHRYFNPNLATGESLKAHFTYKYEKYPVTNFTLADLIEYDCHRKDEALLKKYEDNPEFELAYDHPLRQAGRFLNSPEIHDFMMYITGKSLSYDNFICFASRYSAGDYNGSHNDGSFPRSIAFVLNMTKDWLIHWGGNLVVMDENFENVIEDFTPRFNNLVLFDVPLPHAVLPVSAFCPSDRYALSGWYYDSSFKREKIEKTMKNFKLELKSFRR